jgi:hypothetical protein
MKPIQPILVLFLLLIAGVYFLRLRKKSYDRLIVIFFIVAGVILVMMPDLSAEIARVVGVGRGVDLVLYLGLLGLSSYHSCCTPSCDLRLPSPSWCVRSPSPRKRQPGETNQESTLFQIKLQKPS